MEVVSRFSDRSDTVTVCVSNGAEAMQKTISYDSYLQFLLSAQDNSYIDLPKLPKGYLSGKIQTHHRDSFTVNVVVPETVTGMKFMGQTYIVPFPALLMKFCVVGGRLNSSNCFALMSQVVTKDTKLYQYPFGNVSTDGHICWGQNRLPKIEALSDVDKLVALFYGSDSNSDYWAVGTHVKEWSKRERTVGKFLSYLSKKEKFPSKLLVEKPFTAENIII